MRSPENYEGVVKIHLRTSLQFIAGMFRLSIPVFEEKIKSIELLKSITTTKANCSRIEG